MDRFVLASSSLPQKCARALAEHGFEIISLPEYYRLQKPVASHPDMLMFISDRQYITTSEYYYLAEESLKKLNALGLVPILTDETPTADYPGDVLFNSLLLGDLLLGLEKAMSRTLKGYAEKNSISRVNVRQGYTKCSVCKVSDNAIITADETIAKAAEAHGTDVLRIREGYVGIDGYGYGFIGGASGTTEDAVYFCGDVLSHPDGKRIAEFCEKHQKCCISLSNDTLFDVGTLFFLSKV